MRGKAKKRILILSDLWGDSRRDWAASYITSFQEEYEVLPLCSATLAGINPEGKDQEELHRAFVDGGIDRAVHSLLDLNMEATQIIGLSIGGTIAWRAALAGFQTARLTTVSATRLRLEMEKPDIDLTLIYGERDIFKPQPAWAEMHNLLLHNIPGKGHEVYLNARLVKRTAFG